MIKGSKHYFTLFGIMRETVNIDLHKTFSQIQALFAKHIFIEITQSKQTTQIMQKHQTYQGY